MKREPARTQLAEAFEQLGGVEAMVDWARGKPGDFYALWAKLLPLEIKSEISGPQGGPILHAGIDRPPRETREQWLERQAESAGAAGALPPPALESSVLESADVVTPTGAPARGHSRRLVP